MHVGEPGLSILERCVVLVPSIYHIGFTRGSQKTNHTLGFSVFPIEALMAMAGGLCRPRNSSKQMSYEL